MTLRERLADWLTCGALTRGRYWISVSQRAIDHMRDDVDRADLSHAEACRDLLAAHDTLRRIAACETTGANATVRRMAKMAREALE